jgi:hydroxyacylglutathione hydrolase
VTVAPDRVLRVKNRQFWSNTYIVRGAVPGECLLIDPGLDKEGIADALAEAGLTPTAIFCTHGHFDHLGSAEQFRRAFDAPIHLHDADRRVARASNFLMMAIKVPGSISLPETHVNTADGFSWSRGSDRVDVLHVPGHTPGSTVLIANGAAFTGDTLYRDDTFLTALPEQDPPRLAASILGLWDTLPDAMTVYPGHGRAATFGEIKRSNLPLRQFLGLAEPVAT